MRDLFSRKGLTVPLADANLGRQKLTDHELAEFARDYVAMVNTGVTKVVVELARGAVHVAGRYRGPISELRPGLDEGSTAAPASLSSEF